MKKRSAGGTFFLLVQQISLSKICLLRFKAPSSFRFFIGYWILNEAGSLSGFSFLGKFRTQLYENQG